MMYRDRRFAPLLLGVMLVLVLCSPALAQGGGTLEGLVVNGTEGGPEIGSGVPVTLYVRQGDTEVKTLEAETDDAGRFRFEGLDTETSLEYWPEVEYLDVAYGSAEPLQFEEGTAELATTILVFETTEEDSAVTLNSVHFIAESFGEVLRISEIHLLGNDGDRTYVGQAGEDGRLATVSISLPENAVGVALEQQDSAERFLEVENGIVDSQPVPPGQETSMVFFSYHLMVMGDTVSLERAFAYPLAHLNALVAQPDLQLNSEQLILRGPQSFQGSSYDLYTADDLPAGTPLTMEFVPVAVPGAVPATGAGAEAAPPTGIQNAAGSSTRGNQELLRSLGFGLAALAVAGAIVYGVTNKRTPPAPASKLDLSADPQARQLLVELADLEDAFEAGQVTKGDYGRQRAALVAALRSLQT